MASCWAHSNFFSNRAAGDNDPCENLCVYDYGYGEAGL